MRTRSGDPKGVYVDTECCLSCGVPWEYAPDIFGDGETTCVVKRQPATPTEYRRVLRVFRTQDIGCIRYGGDNPRVLNILSRVGCANECDRSLPSNASSSAIPAGLGRKKPSSMLRRRMVGAAESILGILILNWAFRYGVYDESSLGTVYLLWGTLAAIFCLLIPGVLLVVRPTRWGCQVLPALLGLFVGGTLLLGMLAR